MPTKRSKSLLLMLQVVEQQRMLLVGYLRRTRPAIRDGTNLEGTFGEPGSSGESIQQIF